MGFLSQDVSEGEVLALVEAVRVDDKTQMNRLLKRVTKKATPSVILTALATFSTLLLKAADAAELEAWVASGVKHAAAPVSPTARAFVDHLAPPLFTGGYSDAMRNAMGAMGPPADRQEAEDRFAGLVYLIFVAAKIAEEHDIELVFG